MVIRPKAVNTERAPDPRSSSFVQSAGCSPGTALAAALLQAKLALRMASDTRIAIESVENYTLYLYTHTLFFGYQDCQGEKGV